VRRGGERGDARSNITMQRSATRSTLMTSMCHSRPLMVALGVQRSDTLVNMHFRRQRIFSEAHLCIALFCLSCTQAHRAHTSVFDYSDFGPPNISYELIGKEWYQWNSQGPDDPNQTDDVKVVVYRNLSLEEVKAMYPVIDGKRDYRYLEYSRALEHLNKFEQDAFWNDYPETRERMRKTRERIVKELGR
jgi:hypothetical protein